MRHCEGRMKMHESKGEKMVEEITGRLIGTGMSFAIVSGRFNELVT